MKRIIVVLFTLLSTEGLAFGTDEACHTFLIKRGNDGLAIERVDIADGQDNARTFEANQTTGIVDVIMPVGPGGSGSVARFRDQRTITATCTKGELQIVDRSADGKVYERPVRRMEELARYDTRVSVVGADGTLAAFEIRRYDTAATDRIGPVMDMFAGKIPVSDGDHILFTDTYLHAAGSPIAGEAAVEYDRWPLVTATLPDGTTGTFLVDVGAGTTVVAKSFLPKKTKIEKTGMVQYSAAGKQTLKYAPGGATGQVQSVVGQATLPHLNLGGIAVTDVQVDVLSKMPDMFGRPIAGILGLDLMRRTELLTIGYSTTAGAAPFIRLSDRDPSAAGAALELPFAIVKTHVMVKGEVNGKPVHFILDTGAPGPILDASAAKAAEVESDTTTARSGRGLDGGSATITRGSPARLTLAGRTLEDVSFNVSDLSVFSSMRVHGQNVGLLGNAFFARFARMELDFVRRVVRFVEK